MSTSIGHRSSPHRSFGTVANLLSAVESHHRTLILSLRDEHLNLCALAEEYNTLLSVVAPEEELIVLIKPPCFLASEEVHFSANNHSDNNTKVLLRDDLLRLILSGAPPSSFPAGYGPHTLDEQAALLPPPPTRRPVPSTASLVYTVHSTLGAHYLHYLDSAVPPTTQVPPPEGSIIKKGIDSNTATTSPPNTPHQDALLLLNRMMSVELDSAAVLDSLTRSTFLQLLPLLASWLGKGDPSINGTNSHVQRLYTTTTQNQSSSARGGTPLSTPLSTTDHEYSVFSEQVFINAAFILIHESISMFTNSGSENPHQNAGHEEEGTGDENNTSTINSFLLDKSARRDWRLITAALANIEENDELMVNFKWRDSIGHLRAFILAAANL